MRHHQESPDVFRMTCNPTRFEQDFNSTDWGAGSNSQGQAFGLSEASDMLSKKAGARHVLGPTRSMLTVFAKTRQIQTRLKLHWTAPWRASAKVAFASHRSSGQEFDSLRPLQVIISNSRSCMKCHQSSSLTAPRMGIMFWALLRSSNSIIHGSMSFGLASNIGRGSNLDLLWGMPGRRRKVWR